MGKKRPVSKHTSSCRLIRVEDVAYICNVPKKTVERWVQNNHLDIPFFRLGERTLRFSRDGIYRWISHHAYGDLRFVILEKGKTNKSSIKGGDNEG